MSQTTLIILIVCACIILAVLLYNVYQENQYRKKIRAQFGHADGDALLKSATAQSRDQAETERLQPALVNPVQGALTPAEPASFPEMSDELAAKLPSAEETAQMREPYAEPVFTGAKPTAAPAPAFTFEKVALAPASQTKPEHRQKLLLNLNDMADTDLPWFDKRIDYMAYVSLREPQELHAIPRLSSRSRFRIIGCTMDGRFQPAEPIPSVYYQGFVIGLQAISRSGLASSSELVHFTEQVNEFARQTQGGLLLTDIDEFLAVARPLDELCARVDQTIGIHLVSRDTITGTELRAAVEAQGFELSHDGAFHTFQNNGEILFSIVTLDGKSFTSQLLAAQTYRGFTMLFDTPHIPPGEKVFNQFMDLAVRLSSQLGLDLVDDKLNELSTQWLKDIRAYVLARQDEMKSAEIIPGSDLAQRLFS